MTVYDYESVHVGSKGDNVIFTRIFDDLDGFLDDVKDEMKEDDFNFMIIRKRLV